MKFPFRSILSLITLIGVQLILQGCSGDHLSRAPLVRGLHSALKLYAYDHQGWFPNSDKDSVDALQKLYPEYCPSGRELAGLSGNIDAVVRRLQSGQPLTRDFTSWEYVPGLKSTDDRNLLILWERKPGIFANGKRNPSGERVAILLSGVITNIPSADWDLFMKQQEALRKAAQIARASQTNGVSLKSP